jgi:hypothetical protein
MKVQVVHRGQIAELPAQVLGIDHIIKALSKKVQDL